LEECRHPVLTAFTIGADRSVHRSGELRDVEQREMDSQLRPQVRIERHGELQPFPRGQQQGVSTPLIIGFHAVMV
jgi:hypothetical protein